MRQSALVQIGEEEVYVMIDRKIDTCLFTGASFV